MPLQRYVHTYNTISVQNTRAFNALPHTRLCRAMPHAARYSGIRSICCWRSAMRADKMRRRRSVFTTSL